MKSLFNFKIFQRNAKACLLPRLCTKKSHLTWSMIHTKWSNFTGSYAWQRIVIGQEKSRHCQTWLERRSSLNENLQRKQNWTAKSTNLEENAGKIKSGFVIGAALWAKKLGSCLENYRSWKNTLGKLVVTVNLLAIWFEFWKERKWRRRFLSSVVGDSQISLI